MKASPFFLTVGFALCLAASAAFAAETPGRIVLANAALRAEIVPEWAGRMVFFGRPDGPNALFANPGAASATTNAAGNRVWKNVGGNKTWVGEMEAAWPGFQEPSSDAFWPPPAWFDSEPLEVVRADATNVLMRSGVHTNAALAWTVSLEREFTLLPDRLVLHERLRSFPESLSAPCDKNTPRTPRTPREIETPRTPRTPREIETPRTPREIETPRTPRTPREIETSRTPRTPREIESPRDDPRRIWSNTQIPLVPHVAIRLEGQGRWRLLRDCPAPVPREDGSAWADIDFSDPPKHARIDADGDAIAAEIPGVGWLVIEQTAPARCLSSFSTPSRAIVYATGRATALPFAELEFVALGPDAEQTVSFRILDGGLHGQEF